VDSGRGPLTDGSGLLFELFAAGFVPGDETVQVGTVGAVGEEVLFIEKTLTSAANAYLVGTALGTNRPTHFAVPTATEDYDACSRQTGCDQP
jgi:hypothetical protein